MNANGVAHRRHMRSSWRPARPLGRRKATQGGAAVPGERVSVTQAALSLGTLQALMGLAAYQARSL
jgi:hypothetical protein